jgi:hypothetical protein
MSFRDAEEELHEAARRATGLDDFGGDDHLEGLRTLLTALDEEASLSPLGEQVVRGMIVDALASRLFSEHGFSHHPECAEAAVARPLVIIGLPRTGTTALHHLLAQDPRLQGLERWLAATPKPRPPREAWGEDPQFRECDGRMKLVYERSPDLKAIHFMAADLVDECWYLLSQSFCHGSWEANVDVPSYSRWYALRDARPDYRRHRRNLQLIGHREPERRWLLKDATHLHHMDAFLDIYPDALVVQTHRDPVEAVASVCSLCWSARRPLNEKADPVAFGRETLALWERAILRSMEVRRGRDEKQFFDLSFVRFRSDPLGSIRDIYRHFELPYDEQAATRMRAFRDVNPPGRHGAHAYSLEDWGLRADSIAERLRPYVEAFDVPHAR